MGRKQRPIPKGALLTVTSGAYSDYTVQGVFRATNVIDVEARREAYLKLNPHQGVRHRFDVGQFLASLADCLEPVHSWELFLGCYGDAGEMGVYESD